MRTTIIAFTMGGVLGFASWGNVYELVKAAKKGDALKVSGSLVALLINAFLLIGTFVLYSSIGD